MSHATTPGLPPSPPAEASDAPSGSRLSRVLWGGPLTVRRAWLNVAIGQVAVFASLYAASDEVAVGWRVGFLVAAVALEVNYVGQVVQAYRHRRRRREWPYAVG